MRCIKNYTKLTVSLITLTLAIFILSGANLAYESLQTKIDTQEKICEETQVEEIINADDKIEKMLTNAENLQEQIWQIEIPAINLIAPIHEDTTQEVMLEYVGHFKNTAFWKGNVGLAAHNRRVSNKLF